MGIISEEMPIMVDDSVFTMRAKEVMGWSPSFNEFVSINEEDNNRFEHPNLNFEEDDRISITSYKVFFL